LPPLRPAAPQADPGRRGPRLAAEGGRREEWRPVLTSVLLTLSLLLPAQAQVRGDVSTFSYDTDVSTRRFEVLDVDFAQGRVLFRHVYRLTGDAARGLGPGVDCGYEGLGPAEGEVIGVYDLRRDGYDVVFPLHAPVRSPDACTAPEEAALVQQTINERVARLGLNLEGRPAGIPPAAEGDFFSLPVKGRAERVSLTVESRRATAADEQADPRLLEVTEAGHRVALARLEAKGRVLYTRYQVLDDSQDVGREVTFLQVFLDEDNAKAVILERYYHRPRGQAPQALFSFSPVLDLVALLDGLEDLPEDDVVKRRPKRKKKKAARPREAGPQDETCTESCCSCGCMACLAPLVGGACGCAICFDGCASFERKIFGGDDEAPYDEIPPEDPDDDEDDGDKDEDEDDPQYVYGPRPMVIRY
jgi:hypothetical protein